MLQMENCIFFVVIPMIKTDSIEIHFLVNFILD